MCIVIMLWAQIQVQQLPVETANPRSAIFKGSVWHHRYQPTEHKFRYRVFMMYLDLAELDVIFRKSILWGFHWYNAARFKRSDYFSIDGNYAQSVEGAVRQEVKSQIDVDISGPVCVLTNLRYFGYITNPISCYYCFNEKATGLVALLIEVTNTPWGEKHHYVLDLRSYSEKDTVDFEKRMHVSPFMPMNRSYRWRGAMPSDTLRYSLSSVVEYVPDSAMDRSVKDVQFDSGVVLKRQPISGRTLNLTLLFYPFMTCKVTAAIYWQALKLWVKKVPFVPHPAKSAPQ